METSMLDSGKVELQVDADGIATVSFFHPKHNSLPGALLTQLAQAIMAAGQNPATRVIVLRSAGNRTFCAGASFEELQGIETMAQAVEFFSGFARVINACRVSPKIIVGQVQGKAVGGGVGLAAATDYCFASAEAAVKLSELAIGIGPFVVGPIIERKMGLAAFTQMALDATGFRTATWAQEQGLYAELHANQAALDTAVQSFARKLASYAPQALMELKKVLWQGTEDWDTLLTERARISSHLLLADTASAVEQLSVSSSR